MAQGVAAPEAANNASDQTAFIPTLTLGIPGTPTMALMLGALMIHGISPGPGFITENPDVAWGLIMSFWVGNLILLILNIPLIGLWIRVLSIPYHFLFPAIVVFVCVGTYSVSNSVFDVWMVLAFGAAGYLLRCLSCPVAPFILGFVLGPMLEEQFRRAMLVSRDGLLIFVERPISAGFLVAAALVVALGAYSAWRRARSTG